ncbi:hypothetical protein D3C72_421190 [compost metagenome]
MPMTPKEWAECVLILREVYGDSFKKDEAGIRVWYELLKDLPGSHVKAAVIHMAKTTKAFPSVMEIRQYAEGRTDEDAEAALAFEEVTQKAHQLLYPTFRGSEHGLVEVPVEWNDPLALEALNAMGGARAYCECLQDDMPAFRAHFYRTYKAFAARQSLGGTFKQLGLEPPGPRRPQLTSGLLRVLKAPSEPRVSSEAVTDGDWVPPSRPDPDPKPVRDELADAKRGLIRETNRQKKPTVAERARHEKVFSLKDIIGGAADE